MHNKIQSRLFDIIDDRMALVLDLEDGNGTKIGELRPLSRRQLHDEAVIENLTRWRNEHMGNFLTQFVATPERTKRWLGNVVLKTPGQMIFLIHADHRMVGHLGFKNLTCDDVLLDNAMRGERGGHAKLLTIAGQRLNRWLFEEAGVKTIYGYVLTTNVPAIMMNRQIGFGGWTKHPLIEIAEGNETRWEIGGEGERSPDGAYCYRITLTPPLPHGP